MLLKPFIQDKGCLYLSIDNEYQGKYNYKTIQEFIYAIPKEWNEKRINRDGPNYHITITRPHETKTNNLNLSGLTQPEDSFWFPVGVKILPHVAFIVVHYPAGDRFRKAHGLEPYNFHITLGWANTDDHTLDKSIKCLEPEQIVNWDFYKTRTLYQKQLAWVEKLYQFNQSNPDIIAELIDLLCKKQVWDRAYGLALDLIKYNSSKGAYCLLKLCGVISNSKETIELVAKELDGKPVDPEYEDYILSNLNKLNSNEKIHWVNHKNQYTKLAKPRNFTQVYPGIYASAVVKAHHLDWLKLNKITCIVNLTETKEMVPDSELVEYVGQNLICCPISDRGICTMEQMDLLVDKLSKLHEKNKHFIVHCMGGKGRTNMVVACFAIRELNMELDKVIDHMEQTREVIFSKEQMEFMRSYQTKYSHQTGKLSKKFIKSNGKKCPKLMILVGLPGAGKSTFSTHLETHVQDVIRISQDDIGRKACEKLMSENAQSDTLVIVDRCNNKKLDRKDFQGWLKQGQRSWALVFETEKEECVYRAQHRPDHPTLKASSAEKIIGDLANSFEPVSLTEGFEEIIHIKSPDDLNYILGLWQIPPIEITQEYSMDLVKFPRTRHLANIGGASREDLLLPACEVESYLNREIFIEEKIDGANMGISIEPETWKVLFQNRSHYVTPNYAAQFKKLDLWKDMHQAELYEILEPGRHILFGEWVFAKHSIHYSNLPGYFIAFDLYDKLTGKFAGRKNLETLLAKTTIPQIRLIGSGKYSSIAGIIKLANSQSGYYSGPVEGVYVRICDDFHTVARAKIVRNDFICGDTHWSKSQCVENQLSKNE